MNTIERCSSADVVTGLLNLVNAANPVLDTTYGSGCFWSIPNTYRVLGMDLNPTRAKSVCGDFLALPFRSASVPTVIFDPPFHPYVKSYMEGRYAGLGKNEHELRSLFIRGVAECWRVSVDTLLVKCQGYIHNHRPQWMPLWAIEVCGEPFEWLTCETRHKLTSGRWKSQRSLRRVHPDYLLFRKRGNHR